MKVICGMFVKSPKVVRLSVTITERASTFIGVSQTLVADRSSHSRLARWWAILKWLTCADKDHPLTGGMHKTYT